MGTEPWGEDEVKLGILQHLERNRFRLNFDLSGVLLGYGDIKVNKESLEVLDGSKYVHAEIAAHFYVFPPARGMKVRCVVVEKRKDNFECLVLGKFNLTAKRRPEDDFEVGQTVKVELKKVSYVDGVPLMMGKLVEKEEVEISFVEFDEGRSVQDSGVESSGHSLKRKTEGDYVRDAKRRRKDERRRRREMGRLEPSEDGESTIHEDSEDGKRRKKEKKRNAKIFQQNFYEKEEAEMLLVDERQVTNAPSQPGIQDRRGGWR